MNPRRRWLWSAAILLSLTFGLAGAKFYINKHPSDLANAIFWAVAAVVAVLDGVGMIGVVKDEAQSLGVRVLSSTGGRWGIVGVSIVSGATGLLLGQRVVPTWACRIVREAASDRSHCPNGTWATSRSFQLRLQKRTSETKNTPVLVAEARRLEQAAWTVALDSDRSLCVATPDGPWGHAELALSGDCGADGTFPVNLHVCYVKTSGESALREEEAVRAAARLYVREDIAHDLDCRK